jgi:hypothetical protein
VVRQYLRRRCKWLDGVFYESWEGRMRDEFLGETLFFGLDRARVKITKRINDFNQRRPNSALGHQAPGAYAAQFCATCARLRNPEKLRRSRIDPTAANSPRLYRHWMKVQRLAKANPRPGASNNSRGTSEPAGTRRRPAANAR